MNVQLKGTCLLNALKCPMIDGEYTSLSPSNRHVSDHWCECCLSDYFNIIS